MPAKAIGVGGDACKRAGVIKKTEGLLLTFGIKLRDFGEQPLWAQSRLS